MKNQIHILRIKLAQLPASPLVDALGIMLDGYDEIDQQVGEFDEETEVLLRAVDLSGEDDEDAEEYEESHWGERFGKVVAEVERVLHQVVRTL